MIVAIPAGLPKPQIFKQVEKLLSTYPDEKRVLRGVVPLARLVMALPETRLEVLTEARVLSCPAEMKQNDLAEMFDKYNLHSLPVVDAHGRMVGLVQAEHVISFLRDKL